MMLDTKSTMIMAEALEYAKLVAYDDCHKIYIAMDDEEARWYTDKEWTIFTGTPDEIMDQGWDWYHNSCGLQFVEATSTSESSTESEHYSDFHTIIPQGSDWKEEI